MKFFIKTAVIFTLFYFAYFNLYAQHKNEELKRIEVLFDKLFYAKSDSVKLNINQLIVKELRAYTENKHDFITDFKEIKNLSVIKSDDDYIYILNWAVQYSKQNLQYFGFIKFYNRNRGEYYVEEMIDVQDIKNDVGKKVYLDKWYGALYYKIVTIKYKGERHYVLLGWDGNDDFTNKKLIDILYLEDDDTPVLGKEIMEYEGQTVSRLVFEYGERVSMSLRYDEKNKQIIWDHLSPSKQELKGHYEYYGPDLSFDALLFDKGIWKYIPDIEINQ